MGKRKLAWLVLILILLVRSHAVPASPATAPAVDASRYFAIDVIDDQTNRGVPMVELQTTAGSRYYTDSAGAIAFHEPGLMNQKVWFSVASWGYEFPDNGFGSRGVALQTTPGKHATLRIHRINIAERLYRITGYGIYRDSVLLGRRTPIDHPLLNAQITGQDGVLNALYHGKLYWFYGDTNRISFILGNFAMSGATTDLPDRIDPSVGFNLHYFTGPEGFTRAMCPMKGKGVVWLSGLNVLKDPHGHERMLAYFQRRLGMGPVLENGFVIFDDSKQQFEKLIVLPLNPPIYPTGYPFRVKQPDGGEYIYFTTPYPMLRVKADYHSYLDLKSYEAFTCLKPGSRYIDKDHVQLDRDAAGKLVWAWKRNTPPLNPKDQDDLIKAGKMKRDESPQRLSSIDDGKPIMLNNCSCSWNAYRGRYVMIASEQGGATNLGEAWYSDSDRPEGPWTSAKKIITHANKPGDAHDFYNPVHHDFFDQNGGRVIYLEGSYVNTFSGNTHPTPYYEYNQIMYRLDLSDPRLRSIETNR